MPGFPTTRAPRDHGCNQLIFDDFRNAGYATFFGTNMCDWGVMEEVFFPFSSLSSPPPLLLLPSPHPSCSPQNGTTPLMTAARYANLSSVKLLVRYGADVNMKSRWGRTALDDARKYNKQPRIMDKRDVVAFLEDAAQVRGGVSSPHLTFLTLLLSPCMPNIPCVSQVAAERAKGAAEGRCGGV